MKMYFLFNQDYQFCGIVTEKFKNILEHYSSDWIFFENFPDILLTDE